jgi:hypothetical protein
MEENNTKRIDKLKQELIYFNIILFSLELFDKIPTSLEI